CAYRPAPGTGTGTLSIATISVSSPGLFLSVTLESASASREGGTYGGGGGCNHFCRNTEPRIVSADRTKNRTTFQVLLFGCMIDFRRPPWKAARAHRDYVI